MVFEMYFDDGLNVEQLNATAATLIINKQILTTNKTNIKNIIQFTKSIKNQSTAQMKEKKVIKRIFLQSEKEIFLQ